MVERLPHLDVSWRMADGKLKTLKWPYRSGPEELRAKRNSILKHQSQMESAPFLGNDERLFWQRSEDRNRGTAALYDQLGLACYEAMEPSWNTYPYNLRNNLT